MTSTQTVSGPDPRLLTLNKLVGSWKLKHKDLNTGEEWEGQDTFEWLEGDFFLAMHHEEFGKNIKGMMLIGYEKQWGEEKPRKDLMGHWFETTTGNHFIYIWEVTNNAMTFWLESRDSGMAFSGVFSDDFNTVTGAWKWPGGGYMLTMTKLRK
jgi:hypothetical protein